MLEVRQLDDRLLRHALQGGAGVERANGVPVHRREQHLAGGTTMGWQTAANGGDDAHRMATIFLREGDHVACLTERGCAPPPAIDGTLAI
jgi:hypothetical protein